jgi:demethylmenaquinone methyltransferase/2-methoxy-6-polyprenyl-1,4-benzoquinol methylase
MFDAIAARYDRVNRALSLGMDRRWRRRLVEAVGPLAAGDEVLDVATGTGDVALALLARHPGLRVVGLDPSAAMLARAASKRDAAALAGRLLLIQGDAAALPFADGRFAACCVAFGVRNMPDRPAALAELVRVTRPGGRVGVLELAEPAPGALGWLARLHVHHVVPRLGALLSSAPEYRYLQRSIAAFPAAPAFEATLRAAGLDQVRSWPLAFGACRLFVGERRAAPALGGPRGDAADR